MSKLDFSVINKSSTLSFKAQRKLIKQLGQGKTMLCQHCQKPLKLTASTSTKNTDGTGVHCVKGCTDIVLEFC